VEYNLKKKSTFFFNLYFSFEKCAVFNFVIFEQ
jgi:hypothetical protein